MGRHRCAVRCRPVVVCRVWPVPPPLSDVPADRRGVGVAARTDHGHAVGRRGHGRRRRHVRRVHGPVPGVPCMRGRLPVARAVRPDDGARRASRSNRSAPAARGSSGGSDWTSCCRIPRSFGPPRSSSPSPGRSCHAACARSRHAGHRRSRGCRGVTEPAGGRTSVGRSPSSPGACRIGGSTRSTSPRSASSPETAGASSSRERSACCGALAAHNGRLDTARTLARRNAKAFAGIDHVIVNSAGCGAHMQDYGELVEGTALPVHDVMAFLDELGPVETPPGPLAQPTRRLPRRLPRPARTGDPQSAALGAAADPGYRRSWSSQHGDRCCGAAGLYNVLEPEMSRALMRQKAEAVRDTGASRSWPARTPDAPCRSQPGCGSWARTSRSCIPSSSSTARTARPPGWNRPLLVPPRHDLRGGWAAVRRDLRGQYRAAHPVRPVRRDPARRRLPPGRLDRLADLLAEPDRDLLLRAPGGIRGRHDRQVPHGDPGRESGRDEPTWSASIVGTSPGSSTPSRTWCRTSSRRSPCGSPPIQQRLGDRWANTVVVTKESLRAFVPGAPGSTADGGWQHVPTANGGRSRRIAAAPSTSADAAARRLTAYHCVSVAPSASVPVHPPSATRYSVVRARDLLQVEARALRCRRRRGPRIPRGVDADDPRGGGGTVRVDIRPGVVGISERVGIGLGERPAVGVDLLGRPKRRLQVVLRPRDRVDHGAVREDLDEQDHGAERHRPRHHPEPAVDMARHRLRRRTVELGFVRLEDVVVVRHGPSLPVAGGSVQISCRARARAVRGSPGCARTGTHRSTASPPPSRGQAARTAASPSAGSPTRRGGRDGAAVTSARSSSSGSPRSRPSEHSTTTAPRSAARWLHPSSNVFSDSPIRVPPSQSATCLPISCSARSGSLRPQRPRHAREPRPEHEDLHAPTRRHRRVPELHQRP